MMSLMARNTFQVVFGIVLGLGANSGSLEAAEIEHPVKMSGGFRPRGPYDEALGQPRVAEAPRHGDRQGPH